MFRFNTIEVIKKRFKRTAVLELQSSKKIIIIKTNRLHRYQHYHRCLATIPAFYLSSNFLLILLSIAELCQYLV
ncbi:hypothetical protein BY458DRAFT_495778 [Sporodiniella umbellata]|nr:hypothetical protein BY458DRAFT_495778 [Sporodiniella umbellata]